MGMISNSVREASRVKWGKGGGQSISRLKHLVKNCLPTARHSFEMAKLHKLEGFPGSAEGYQSEGVAWYMAARQYRERLKMLEKRPR